MTIYENYHGGKNLFIDFDLINEKYDINVFSHLIRDTKVCFNEENRWVFNQGL